MHFGFISFKWFFFLNFRLAFRNGSVFHACSKFTQCYNVSSLKGFHLMLEYKTPESSVTDVVVKQISSFLAKVLSSLIPWREELMKWLNFQCLNILAPGMSSNPCK